MTIVRAGRSADQDKEFEAEGEVREAVRRDGAPNRAAEAAAEFGATNINSVIQRVAGTSMQEIDALIQELQAVREILRSEGERVQREIAGYAHLSQAARKSTKVIADSVSQWKNVIGDVRKARG
jgi:hypothetical protein